VLYLNNLSILSSTSEGKGKRAAALHKCSRCCRKKEGEWWGEGKAPFDCNAFPFSHREEKKKEGNNRPSEGGSFTKGGDVESAFLTFFSR